MNDTIVALATPPGRGGIAVIRLSGPQAEAISLSLHNRSKLAWQRPRELILGSAQSNDEAIDQALVVAMPAPNSYTGEDVVELQLHASTAVVEKLISGAMAAGARLAEPGEFTKRAYLNGKLDLMQAEAVADLIDANTEAALLLAERKVSGVVSRQIEQVRGDIVDLIAKISANLDFGEEDIPDLDPATIATDLQGLQNVISLWLDNAKTALIAKDGLRVAIVGLPNAGKSSLLNALVGYERAIVADLAGTTRDTLEESISIHGLGVVFVDTAGLREAAEIVEQQGVARSQAQSRQADVLLVAASAEQNMGQLLEQFESLRLTPGTPVIGVQTKIDMADDAPPSRLKTQDPRLGIAWPFKPTVVIQTSAKTGKGLDNLRQKLYQIGTGSVKVESAFVTSARQLNGLKEANEGLGRASHALHDGAPFDVLAGELTIAAEKLSGLLGESVNKAVIDQIFSNFCIGK